MGTGYKGNRTVYGSWLMDEKALRSLEDVAKNIYDYLKQVQDGLFENMQSDGKGRYSYAYLTETSYEPKIEIKFSDETRIDGKTFNEIFDLLEIRQKIPQNILITLRCLGIEVKLTLSSGKFSSCYFKYEVIDYEKNSSYEGNKNIVIGKIENWIDENKPDLLMHIWYNLAQWTSSLLILLLGVMWVTLLLYADGKEQYFKSFEKEIAEITEVGVTDANIDRAIELILIKEYEYVPDNWKPQRSELSNRILLGCGIGILAGIFMRICPKSNFSIGKGKKRVKLWTQYRKLMFVIIPSVIIIPILINLLV